MQNMVLNTISTGVYVLTAQHQGKINGTTVAWVTPVSYEPLMVMVALAGVRYSHGLVKQSGYFGLNVLKEDQLEIARHFGFKTAHETDKFEARTHAVSEQGLPILDGIKAYIECRVVDSFRTSEHTLFVGEVVSTKMYDEHAQPLLYRQKDYA
jgi:flavin reductase (DIM6/NTAB) family NADH-FMN oxidoreductase RutF